MTRRPAYESVSLLEPPLSHGPIVCKFVVIEDAHTRYLIFGPVARYAYHADLVARFCTDRMIAAGWAQRPDVMEIYDPSVRLHGGGMLEVDQAARTVDVYGASKAYGSYRRADVEGALDVCEILPGYGVSFRNSDSG